MSTANAAPDRWHAPCLGRVRVPDTMHAGVVACSSDTPLRDVARMLVEHRLHCVAVPVIEGTGISTWAIVSDLDLLGAEAAGSLEGRTARDIAGGPMPGGTGAAPPSRPTVPPRIDPTPV